MRLRSSRSWTLFAATASAVITLSTAAQVTPAAGVTPADDTPAIKVGATIFGDYTYVESPSSKDADANVIHPSSFNIGRAYINVTGNLIHWIAFRVTPDISRETGTGPSLTGSQIFRLKYAFAQFNFDDWATKGSWARFGIQQTPYIDYTESIYRYRSTPRLGASGWELLLRHDDFKPNKGLSSTKTKRDIFGVAYWVPNLQKVTTALLVDYDKLRSDNFTPARPDDTRYGLKMLINF